MLAGTTQRRKLGTNRRAVPRKNFLLNGLAFASVTAFATWTATLAFSLSYPNLDTLASPLLVAVHEARADDALRNPLAGSNKAETETRKGLKLAPATSSAWLRLAYIDYVARGRISPVGVSYIDRSFDVAAFGPDVSPWRIRFLFENWTSLPPHVRELAIEELATLSRYRGHKALAITDGIASPEGALAASMTTARARAYDSEGRRAVAQR